LIAANPLRDKGTSTRTGSEKTRHTLISHRSDEIGFRDDLSLENLAILHAYLVFIRLAQTGIRS
jgi:hypothetical protein